MIKETTLKEDDCRCSDCACYHPPTDLCTYKRIKVHYLDKYCEGFIWR